jgi:hypothetical protein
MTDPVPSKDQSTGQAVDPNLRRLRVEQAMDRALNHGYRHGDAWALANEVVHLRRALTGISTCSTCEACRGAARLALGEQPTTGQCRPIFDRAGRCGTCTACGKNFECGAAQPPGDGQ